jgi:hypothetical protein
VAVDIFEAVEIAVRCRHQLDHADLGMAADPRRLVEKRPAGEIMLDGIGQFLQHCLDAD